jgi:hypothetical protein
MKKFNLQSAKFNGSLRKGIRAFGRLSLNFAICTLLIAAPQAQAAKACIAALSNVSILQSAGGEGGYSIADTWSVKFNSANLTVSGRHFCANAGVNNAPSHSPKADTPAGNACWCKMTSPISGPWVMAYDYTASWSDGCRLASGCSSFCTSGPLLNQSMQATQI